MSFSLFIEILSAKISSVYKPVFSLSILYQMHFIRFSCYSRLTAKIRKQKSLVGLTQIVISPTFHEQLNCLNFCQKIQRTSRIKFPKKLSYEKAARKMLLKLIPGVNFINVLHANFLFKRLFSA